MFFMRIYVKNHGHKGDFTKKQSTGKKIKKFENSTFQDNKECV